MSREDAINELKECAESGDTESAHVRADNILCDLLESLGYADVVAEFENVTKWYA